MRWAAQIPNMFKFLEKLRPNKEQKKEFNPLELYHRLIQRGYKVKEFSGELTGVRDQKTIYVPAKNATRIYMADCDLLAVINVYNISTELHTIRCKIKNYVRKLS